MSHKKAKRARRLVRETGVAEDVASEYRHMIDWKPVKRGRAMVDRPTVRLIPGSFRSIVKKLKRGERE